MAAFSKLKEVQKLRKEAKKIKNVLEDVTVQGQALGGKIHITMNGNQDLESVEIDPSLLDPSQKEKLQKGIVEGINTTTKEIQKTMAKKIRSGEISMPDLGSIM